MIPRERVVVVLSLELCSKHSTSRCLTDTWSRGAGRISLPSRDYLSKSVFYSVGFLNNTPRWAIGRCEYGGCTQTCVLVRLRAVGEKQTYMQPRRLRTSRMHAYILASNPDPQPHWIYNWAVVRRTSTGGLVRITSWYPNFNGIHLGLPPSDLARSPEWLDCYPKSCELWRIRTGPSITHCECTISIAGIEWWHALYDECMRVP